MNVIALVWDFDKTLVDGYMQDPIFERFGVDSTAFWGEVNALPERYRKKQGVDVNPDTIYLNQFIKYAHDGTFAGLSNESLKGFGKELRFYPGVPEIFDATRRVVEDEPSYKEYDIRVEHYIVSTGIKKVIEGSVVAEKVERIWGCEFIEDENDGDSIISEVGYTIDNTTKTRALFEINKGVGIGDRNDIDANTCIPEDQRRVKFSHMIYIADGPSDVPSFSLVNKNGGATFAVYPKGDEKALHQVEQMRKEGRVNMYAEADYSENTTAYLWLREKVREFAEDIRKTEHGKLMRSAGESPRHLV